MTDAAQLHGTVMTCARCDFEPRPRTTTTVPIGPMTVRPNLEVAAVRLRWVGENDARVSEAGDSDHTRVDPARWCNCIRYRMQLHQRAGSTRVWSESPASLTLASFSPTHRSRTAATSRLGRTVIGPIGTVVVVRGRGSKSQRAQVMTVPCSCAASVTSRRAGHTHRDPAPTQRRSRSR